MQEKYLSKAEMQTILDSRPKGVSLDDGLKMYINNGWTIQGVNDQPKVTEKPAVSQPKMSLAESMSKSNIDPNLATAMGADTGSGFAKGAKETALNIGTGAQNVAQAVVGQDKGFKTLDTGTPENTAYRQSLEANPNEVVGKGLERVAEFFVPGALGVKAGATANFLTKALVEGLGTGAVATAQTGDIKKGAAVGALAGGISAGIGALGAGARYFGVPEKLYNTIFKSNSNAMIQELKSEGIANLQKTNPEQFASLVKDGIIKLSGDGAISVNESLAKQALDRGLRGSIENMSNGVVMNLLTAEQAAQNIAKTTKQTIKVPEKQFANVFGEIAKDYENVGFGDTANTAKRLQTIFTKGDITAEDALTARRLLDGLRIRSSFIPDSKLSTSQDNLKFLADELRKRLTKIEGFADVMKEYAFNIKAMEALSKEAVRRGNSNVITLVEGTLLGGGSPVGAGIYAGKKLLNTPTGITNIANAINKTDAVSNTAQAARAAISSPLVQ